MNTERTRFVDQSNLVSVAPSSMTWAQLQPGELSIAYKVLTVGPLAISSRVINLGLHIHAQVAPNKSGIMIVESDGEARWRGSLVDAGRLAVGNEIDVRTTGASALFGIAVDHRDLQKSFPDSLDASDLVDRLASNKVTNNANAAARLRAAIKSVCDRQSALPSTVSGTIIPMLAAVLEEAREHSVERSHHLNRRYSAIRTCDLYMREHIDDTITLLDLSRVCGLRSRSLINAFEAIMGSTPMDYLKRLRLSAVRSRLLRVDARSTRIIDVAMESGFWHMGHFARDYRAMFGEAPSQTLSARRAFSVM